MEGTNRVGERVTYVSDGERLVGTIVPTEPGYPPDEFRVRWDNGNFGAMPAHRGGELVPLAVFGVELLADELNQFAMAVEKYARGEQALLARLTLSAEVRQRRELMGDLFDASRRMRERIAGLIPE